MEKKPDSGYRINSVAMRIWKQLQFFKHLNSVVCGRNKGVMMIAEESTAWPKVTGSPEDDGLGFSYKWNMGWMHDFTEYMKLDPYFSKKKCTSYDDIFYGICIFRELYSGTVP